mmetsp:Transcript_8623/g.14822  ORF Transcript_8623/g.14822 Transcript_8623/m.14822 type:complete len:143 (-) Transcript_8623:157-585(-)
MVSSTSMLVLVALALVAVAKASGDFERPHVAHLTASNYDEKVNDGKVWFVKYYAPWCGHCKRLVDTWGELASNYKDSDKVGIAHIDCTVARDVCQAADVKGYPTLKVIHKGEEYKAYRGARELGPLKSFIEEASQELTEESS